MTSAAASEIDVRLLMIRHGQSTWNASGRWQGRADPGLSDLGVQQARHAATRLADLGVVRAITSSQLIRARRTAEILAEAGGLELLEPIDHFQERHIGPWEGLTRVQIEERWPGFLAARRRPDEVETDAAVVERVVAGLAELADRDGDERGDRVAVVSHGGVIIAMQRAASGSAETIANLTGQWFRWSAGRLSCEGERVRLLDDFEATGTGDPNYA